MNKRKDKLLKIISDARNELDEINSIEIKKEALPLVGNCYKFHNSYSSDEKWWLYMKVISFEDDSFKCFKFQHTTANIIEIEFHQYLSVGFEQNSGYKKIRQEEFDQAFLELMTTLKNQSPVGAK